LSAQPQAVQRVFEAARAGDMAGAKRLAVEALGAGHEHPALLNLRALDHEENGRLDAALADLTRAQALSPADFSILNARGLCLARLGRLGEAAECYEAALALRADFAPAWFNLGVAKEQLGETAEAAAAYARAAELQPGHVQAWANLAWLASRRGDAAGAAANAERAFALQPGNVTAALALAAIELTEPATAEARLRGLLARADLTPYDCALALGQLGDALDAQSRPTEAFAAYAQSNAGFRAEAAPRFEGQTSIADTLAWLVPWAQRLDPAAWTASPIGADREPARPVSRCGLARGARHARQGGRRLHGRAARPRPPARSRGARPRPLPRRLLGPRRPLRRRGARQDLHRQEPVQHPEAAADLQAVPGRQGDLRAARSARRGAELLPPPLQPQPFHLRAARP
jgi:tetratricopeptide (TPR) repeat protein